jgi:uncharacterized membrane protein
MSLTTGQVIAGVGIVLAVISIFVPAYPLLVIGVVCIGASKFVA